MKIGLFGGSFDPIHKGHIALAKKAIETLSLDSFWFIPAKNNPWKANKIADDEARVKMIEIAIKNLNKVKVSRIELDTNDKKNYTIDTIKKLLILYPDNEYFYLIGMDQVCAFNYWKSAEQFPSLVQLVAFNRGGYPKKHPNLDKYHFIKIENILILASSTEAREGNLEILDQEVLRYISSHGLYLDTMIEKRMKKKRYEHSLSVAALTKEFALFNHVDPLKGYIAGILHDVAKEMDMDLAREMMKAYYPSHLHTSPAIWHQWLSSYIAKYEFLIDDQEILKAIEDHTTASCDMSVLGKCLYCADKLDPLRGYDSSKQIEICKKDIHEGFRNALIEFYDFSKKKNRKIDSIFFDVYNKYVKE
ncbi:nicotinate-nucleotide adenylyltransferase [Eggerthia catenaformis]|uniref:nicotinate-nucleotide adenylyltransferase n=1 Tax=Eggerthia catenaformis TaxID=31973 RepID=UPI003C6F142B